LFSFCRKRKITSTESLCSAAQGGQDATEMGGSVQMHWKGLKINMAQD